MEEGCCVFILVSGWGFEFWFLCGILICGLGGLDILVSGWGSFILVSRGRGLFFR